MAYRPTWQGHLRLSLVTCPVALYTATSSGGDVRFNLINPETNNRIRMVTTDPDTGPVERSSLVKGYAVAKDEYILLTDEEIKSVKLESTKTIDIERFVPEEEIDRLYWDNPYYLAPAGALAEEAFGVIREAMRSEGKIALGRVVLSTRETGRPLPVHGEWDQVDCMTIAGFRIDEVVAGQRPGDDWAGLRASLRIKLALALRGANTLQHREVDGG